MAISNDIGGLARASLASSGPAPVPEQPNPLLGAVGLPGRWALAGRILLRDPLEDASESIFEVVKRCSARMPADPRIRRRKPGDEGGR